MRKIIFIMTLFILNGFATSAHSESLGVIDSPGYIVGNGMRWDYAVFFKVNRKKNGQFPVSRAYAEIDRFASGQGDFKVKNIAMYDKCIIMTINSYDKAISGKIRSAFSLASDYAELNKVYRRKQYMKFMENVGNSDDVTYGRVPSDQVEINYACYKS